MDRSEEFSLLIRFFQERLKSSKIPHLTLSGRSDLYDGNTPFDLLYYRLQEEAVRYWKEHYGYVPPLGRFHHAFFQVQFARMHRFRTPLKRKLHNLWQRLRLALF